MNICQGTRQKKKKEQDRTAIEHIQDMQGDPDTAGRLWEGTFVRGYAPGGSEPLKFQLLFVRMTSLCPGSAKTQEYQMIQLVAQIEME